MQTKLVELKPIENELLSIPKEVAVAQNFPDNSQLLPLVQTLLPGIDLQTLRHVLEALPPRIVHAELGILLYYFCLLRVFSLSFGIARFLLS
jgi:hypothetical protein